MTMTPGIRKFALTAHVTSSVGWLGAVAGFLALAVAGLGHHNPQIVRASYLAMELIGWCVIVPLSLASLLTGLAQGLGTPWGLFRHCWVVAKLIITVFATILLLVHMLPVGRIAGVAVERTLFSGDLRGLRIQLITDAGTAVLAFLVATALSVFKPWGITAFGRKRAALNAARGHIRTGRIICSRTTLGEDVLDCCRHPRAAVCHPASDR
jgi:hypothetical protein